MSSLFPLEKFLRTPTVPTLLFSAPHSVPPGQQPPRILRFTNHIQSIKFSLVYRVAARKGLLAAERFENLWLLR